MKLLNCRNCRKKAGTWEVFPISVHEKIRRGLEIQKNEIKYCIVHQGCNFFEDQIKDKVFENKSKAEIFWRNLMNNYNI